MVLVGCHGCHEYRCLCPLLLLQSHVDASYLENSRRRLAAAAGGSKAGAKRGIQIMENTTEVIKLGMGTNQQLYTFQKEKKVRGDVCCLC